MKINSWAWILVLIVLLVGCAQEPQPSVSPIGLWQGTLTASDGSVTLPFTAEIQGTKVEGAYRGFFNVDGKAFDVDGIYSGPSNTGDNFFFNDPSEDLQPALSEPVYPGTIWSGVMTETTYEGRWDFNSPSDASAYSSGEFNLERQP